MPDGDGRHGVDVLQRAGDRFASVVASVPTEAWDRPTVCEVSVRELVEHVLAGNRFAVQLLGGATADEARAGLAEARLGTAVESQVAGSCAEQAAAFAAAPRDRLLHHPSGDIDHATFLRYRLTELVVHGWDVAVAAGLDASMDPPSAELLWELVERAGAHLGPAGAFAARPDEPLPAGASTQDRLLHAFGRRAVP